MRSLRCVVKSKWQGTDLATSVPLDADLLKTSEEETHIDKTSAGPLTSAEKSAKAGKFANNCSKPA
jgi:hypothetical protein